MLFLGGGKFFTKAESIFNLLSNKKGQTVFSVPAYENISLLLVSLPLVSPPFFSHASSVTSSVLSRSSVILCFFLSWPCGVIYQQIW